MRVIEHSPTIFEAIDPPANSGVTWHSLERSGKVAALKTSAKEWLAS